MAQKIFLDASAAYNTEVVLLLLALKRPRYQFFGFNVDCSSRTLSFVITHLFCTIWYPGMALAFPFHVEELHPRVLARVSDVGR